MSIIGRFKNLNRLGAECLVVAALAPYLRDLWWALELPAHFHPQIIVASIAVVTIALAFRQRVVAALATVALVNSSLAIFQAPFAAPPIETGLSVISQNLSMGNASFADFTARVESEDPDILVLQEYTPAWDAAMGQLAGKYPHRIAIPDDGVFGIAVFAKQPFTSHEIVNPGQLDAPAIAARFDTATLDLTLVAVHLYAPVEATLAADRDRQLAKLKEYLQGLGSRFVVVGDFNNTPWSPTFAAFIGNTTWHLAGPTLAATWPSTLGMAGIPIDLALASDDVALGSKKAFSLRGSDHRGIRFDIVL